MSRFILVGGDTKRQEYFQRAAKTESVSLLQDTWENYSNSYQTGDIVKLDSPPFAETNLNKLPDFIMGYQKFLQHYSTLSGVHYLNHPDDILAAMDKAETKRRLLNRGIPTPQILEVNNYAQLQKAMQEKGISRVFVKPRYGSGASGILAYACSGTRKILYTTLLQKDGCYYNTKQIHTLKNPDLIQNLLDFILTMGAITEQWIAKPSLNGLCYDLRVVWQNNKIVTTVVRGSKGPITNLHLNNKALTLDISQQENEMLHLLCEQTMSCFPKLYYAGIDIILPKNQKPPLVLEVNAQGDLIHKDIYHENNIYREQIKQMKGWDHHYQSTIF